MYRAKPIPLTPDSITTDLPNTTALAYSAGTTYALDAVVSAIDATGKTPWTHEYKSLQASNTGNALSDPAFWLDTGPTNRHRLLDDRAATETVATGSMTYTLTPAVYFDVVHLTRLRNVSSVQIIVDRGATELFNETITLLEDISNAWDYYFSPLGEWATKFTWRNSVWYSDCEITLTLNGPAGEEIGCGLMMVSRADDLGLTLYGASVSIDDYSTKEIDPTFGTPFLLEREYADRAECQIILDTSQVASVKRKLAAVRATPCLYNLNNGQDGEDDSLIIFGKYDDFSINLENHSKSYCSFSFLELI